LDTTRRPPTLEGKQRRHLRALAHHLAPVAQIGVRGLTDEVLAAVDRALDDHELIKVRVLEGAPLHRKEVGPRIAEVLGAHDVGLVGRVIILYRMHAEEPKVDLG